MVTFQSYIFACHFFRTMQNSESGRKINQAVNNTSRAVGGAISQAKGAFSYWWSSITTNPTSAANSSTGGETTSDDANSSRPQEISVTFQNNANEDKIEVGISVHTEEKVTNKRQSLSEEIKSPQDEKQIDSAEELMEENQLDKIRPVTGTTETEACNLKTESQPSRGIVEIGKEAEVLNKEDNNKCDIQNISNTIEAADMAGINNTTTTSTNGSIFIV